MSGFSFAPNAENQICKVPKWDLNRLKTKIIIINLTSIKTSTLVILLVMLYKSMSPLGKVLKAILLRCVLHVLHLFLYCTRPSVVSFEFLNCRELSETSYWKVCREPGASVKYQRMKTSLLVRKLSNR